MPRRFTRHQLRRVDPDEHRSLVLAQELNTESGLLDDEDDETVDALARLLASTDTSMRDLATKALLHYVRPEPKRLFDPSPGCSSSSTAIHHRSGAATVQEKPPHRHRPRGAARASTGTAKVPS
ncbi:hypothetical protein AV521_12215 [Streptomyces sp. IMTB 2501]|uniref:hypothetical protein n=1 Tax=Streptomyces sp. IMTB 2501 TaxID=1776340 RepID=UPI00096D316A|nr:hypothetical protein [Streptomyces sp. IMTB 2501]OLZ70782.1 hypothetical protein AV521_12215 [Streptomyces sp. IMTB 2501]